MLPVLLLLAAAMPRQIAGLLSWSVCLATQASNLSYTTVGRFCTVPERREVTAKIDWVVKS